MAKSSMVLRCLLSLTCLLFLRVLAADEVPAAIVTAIVTTVRQPPAAMWRDWLCYHLFLGFDHVLVFHDDADDADTIELTDSFPRDRVKSWTRGDTLSELWRRALVWEKVGPFARSEVMARQMLNVEVATMHLRRMYLSEGAMRPKQRRLRVLLHQRCGSCTLTPTSSSFRSDFPAPLSGDTLRR